MKVIYCAGEQGRVVLDIMERNGLGEEEVIFIDDDRTRWGDRVNGVEVVGGGDALEEFNSARTTCVIAFGGEQGVRQRLAKEVRSHGVDLHSTVDRTATIARSATLGSGVIVNAQSYVGPDAELADLVLVDSEVSIAHDVVASEGVTIGPNATVAGGARLKRDVFVGAGSTVIDHVSVEEGAVIGAGAVVVDNVPPATTVAGVPAEPIE